MKSIFAALLSLVPVCAAAAPPTATVIYDLADPQARFAAAEIRSALGKEQWTLIDEPAASKASGIRLRFVMTRGSPAGIPPLRDHTPQAYAIRTQRIKAGDTYFALGADSTGVMYGGLDLAESIRLGTLAALKDSDHVPHIARRGISPPASCSRPCIASPPSDYPQLPA
jgi:hypothetical protein